MIFKKIWVCARVYILYVERHLCISEALKVHADLCWKV